MLDADEYLHLAIHASSVRDHHASISYLKQALLLQPRHATAIYLLAVQHGELGLIARAVTGLKEAVALEPKLEIAQFQLGWMLLNIGRKPEAKEAFAKLKTSVDESMRAFSEAMIALADDNVPIARAKLTAGLARQSANPAVMALMQQLLRNLAAPEAAPAQAQSTPPAPTPATTSAPATAAVPQPPASAADSNDPAPTAFLGAYVKRTP